MCIHVHVMPNIYWTLKTEETEETEEFLSKKCDFRKHYNGSSLEKKEAEYLTSCFPSSILDNHYWNGFQYYGPKWEMSKTSNDDSIDCLTFDWTQKAFVSLKVGYVGRLCGADKALSSRDNGFRCLKEIHSNFKMQSELPYWSEPIGHFSSHFSSVCK